MSHPCPNSNSSSGSGQLSRLSEPGILDERILLMVFERLGWDIHTICRTAAVNCRLRALARRLLWRGLCLHRAPRLVSSLTGGSPAAARIPGGWPSLAKLLFFCGGCGPTRHFRPAHPAPGHLVRTARFSKTSGRSFLARRCRGDVLFVSDPCEHRGPNSGPDIGVYRGVFGSFAQSRTREFLVTRRVEFEEGVRCPYCGARAWSMTAARLIPRRAAARRLGTGQDELEYFVCLNGHLHGACWLVHLSSDDDDDDDEVDADGDDVEFDVSEDDDDGGM
ncbi:EID1-like F-box protein 3 [Striga asiatica]|uniref:EID1-like F-box protein 3 n=1 Tax=Striga asiatica TaxID=4170 RepID=A0A5A7NWE5_STRAF|nr:EID1-like F-box protein 3 [Striga asiatica]